MGCLPISVLVYCKIIIHSNLQMLYRVYIIQTYNNRDLKCRNQK